MDSASYHIECQDLFKIYKRADLEVVALRGLDLRVAPGEIIAIVGASGSGKSTLLNILAGLDRPSAGRVRVGQRDLLNVSEAELMDYRRLDVGFVWQATGRNLLSYLTARENVELPLLFAGAPAASRAARARELLEAVGLENKALRRPDELSGGEQQRVAIAVALANNPPLLLADEPTGELDTSTAVEVLQMFRRLNERYGTTIFIVTHYSGIAQFVDRVVSIRDGRINSEMVHVATFQKPGERPGAEQVTEYLVVDQAGRIQLPSESVARLGLKGRAALEVDDDRIVLRLPKE